MTKEKYEEILTYLRGVIAGTRWEGKVYTVGGCLRDAMMGHDIHDVDLAVAVPDGGVLFPLWLEQKGLTLVPPTLYRRFSSSRLRLKKFPMDEIEVVQTRREQYTDANSRNPEVCFGSIMDDCLRRDLTINSLYQNVSTGEILDLTGRGISDIRDHRIETPMTPEETYSDDPIRILRTLRFAVRYGWEIPEHLWEAMKANAGRMKIVRRPRVATEFEKIMTSNDPVRLMQMMKELGVMYRVMPELCHLYRIKDHTRRVELGPNAPLPTLWDLTMEALANAGDSAEDRVAALFSQFHRIKIPQSYGGKRDKEKRDKSHRRGQGRNAVVTTALRRLMYDYDFIREVKARLAPQSSGDTDVDCLGEVPLLADNTVEPPKKKKRRGGRERRRRRNRRKRNGAEPKSESTA